MKKKYFAPNMEVVKIQMASLLAGSINFPNGTITPSDEDATGDAM